MREVGDELTPHLLEMLQPGHIDEQGHSGDVARGKGKGAHLDVPLVRAGANDELFGRLLPGQRTVEAGEDRGVAHHLPYRTADEARIQREQLDEAAIGQHHAAAGVDGQHPFAHAVDDVLQHGRLPLRAGQPSAQIGPGAIDHRRDRVEHAERVEVERCQRPRVSRVDPLGEPADIAAEARESHGQYHRHQQRQSKERGEHRSEGRKQNADERRNHPPSAFCPLPSDFSGGS